MSHIIGGREIEADYNQIYLHEDDEKVIAKVEMWTAKAVGEELVKHYPNRQWGVHVDVVGRMVTITCPSLSVTHGYHLPMKQDTIEGMRRRAVIAGGEILERHGLSRSRAFNPDKLEDLLRDPMGEAIARDSEGVDPIIR